MEKKLTQTIEKCQDKNNSISEKMFPRIYPFTTENLTSLLSYFNLEDKTLLTVDSSSDLAINANLLGAKDVTIMNKAFLVEDYFYLKKAALLTLSYQEFINYFVKVDNEGDTFSLDLYKKLRDYLKLLNYNSFLLWDKLYELFPGSLIRSKLFKNDEEKLSTLENISPYLQSEESYLQEKAKIKDFTPIFIKKSIKENISSTYDNIFLSNSACFMQTKELVDTYREKIRTNLNEFGKILIRYIYYCLDDKKLDIERFFYSYFDDLVFSFDKELIPGVDSFNLEKDVKDGLLIYQKR